MRVTTNDIKSAFDDLISGARTREEISSWASEVRASDDHEPLVYSPSSAEEPIWSALEFLMGVDLKDGPDTFLHNEADFRAFWESVEGQFTA